MLSGALPVATPPASLALPLPSWHVPPALHVQVVPLQVQSPVQATPPAPVEDSPPPQATSAVVTAKRAEAIQRGTSFDIA
jgi:hypothetical protein